jgi:hypothetical protein
MIWLVLALYLFGLPLWLVGMQQDFEKRPRVTAAIVVGWPLVLVAALLFVAGVDLLWRLKRLDRRLKGQRP